MADPVPDRTRTTWLWILVIAVLALVLLALLIDPSGDAEEVTATVAEDGALQAPAAGDYGTAPTDPAATADLPEAAMTSPAATPQATQTATPEPAPAP